jgi:hypothetical protein
VRVADIVSAKRKKMHGPYYTEKQVIRAILDPPKDTLRAIVDKNKFWIECEQPKIETDGKHYIKWDVLSSNVKYYARSFKLALNPGLSMSDAKRVAIGAIGVGANALSAVAIGALAALASAWYYNDYSQLQSLGLYGASAGIGVGIRGLKSVAERYYLNKPASEENQAMLRQRDSKTIGDEAASAAIPRVDDTFNLGAFHFDASPDMCALALQNAERAASAVTDPRI